MTGQTHDFVRGCGLRKPGKIYHVVPTSVEGLPIWFFVLCPPLPVPEGFIAAQGITLLPRRGADGQQQRDPMGALIWDAWDHIGADAYPNPADFIMEAGYAGISRLFPITSDFSRLTKWSYHILVHPTGWEENSWPLYQDRQNLWSYGYPLCPGKHEQHLNPTEDTQYCAGLHMETVKGGTEISGRLIKRTMPGFTYSAARPPDNHEEARSPAVILRVPMTGFEIVAGVDEQTTTSQEKALEKLASLGAGLGGNVRIVQR